MFSNLNRRVKKNLDVRKNGNKNFCIFSSRLNDVKYTEDV